MKGTVQYDDHAASQFRLIDLRPTDDPAELTEQPHRHHFHQLFLFTEGSGSHQIDFDNYEVAPGMLHLINQGMVHCLNRNADAKGYVIIYGPELLSQELLGIIMQHPSFYLFQQNMQAGVQLESDELERLLLFIKQLKDLDDSPLPLRHSLTRTIVNSLVLTIQALLDKHWEKQPTGIDHNPLVQQFKTLIEQHYSKEHSAAFYAASLNVSSDTLNKALKSSLGTTIGKYLQFRILTEAKRLLYYSNSSVKEIAYRLGYEDDAYFGRVFRKGEGQSPLEFRDYIREKHR